MAQPALFREARRLATRPEMREYQFEIIPAQPIQKLLTPENLTRDLNDVYENTC